MARTKGAKNKISQSVKENIVAVFTRLGGTAAMAAWAQEHRSEFYRMYGQLAPKEISADVTLTDETSLTDAELAAIATGSSDSAIGTETGETGPSGIH